MVNKLFDVDAHSMEFLIPDGTYFKAKSTIYPVNPEKITDESREVLEKTERDPKIFKISKNGYIFLTLNIELFEAGSNQTKSRLMVNHMIDHVDGYDNIDEAKKNVINISRGNIKSMFLSSQGLNRYDKLHTNPTDPFALENLEFVVKIGIKKGEESTENVIRSYVMGNDPKHAEFLFTEKADSDW